MPDDSMIYKLLIILLLIALGVMLFMYAQKPSCRPGQRENMQNIQERPWTDNPDDGPYHSADVQGRGRRPFFSRERSVRSDQGRYGPLRRLDEIYDEEMRYEDNYNDYTPDGYERIDDYVAGTSTNRRSMQKLPINNNSIPSAHDDRPDLSMCPPCVCPGDSLLGDRRTRYKPRSINKRRQY